MIEDYRFGLITINGKTYENDVEVRWNGKALPWWRQESHLIGFEDVERAIREEPDLLIIGTGESGMAKVLQETKEKILSEGIGLIIEKTGPAVVTFNREKQKGRKVIGLFHLTC